MKIYLFLVKKWNTISDFDPIVFATRYKKVQLKIAKLPYIGGPDSPDMMVLNVMKLIKF